MARMKQQNTKK